MMWWIIGKGLMNNWLGVKINYQLIVKSWLDLLYLYYVAFAKNKKTKWQSKNKRVSHQLNDYEKK